MGRVQDKVAIVTGGVTGLGFASALRLADEGAKVTITDVDAERGPGAAAEIGRGCRFLAHDVAEEGAWSRVLDTVVGEDGRLDILLNNAGVGIPKNLEETTLEDWNWIMSVNLAGVFLGTREGLKAMKAAGGGSIINMSSIEGLIGDRRLAAYDASKAGVMGLTRSAALHAAHTKTNVRINCINPGFIHTEMVEGFVAAQDDPEATWDWLKRAHAVGHIGEPDDIAWGVVYLASEEAKFITGTELVIDGGYTAR